MSTNCNHGPYQCAKCGQPRFDYGLTWCAGCKAMTQTRGQQPETVGSFCRRHKHRT